MYHNIKTTLYHGTISEIQAVDVRLGRGKKDFGRGFYMATSMKQAEGMMNKKYREAMKRKNPKERSNFSKRLYEVTLDKSILPTLKIKIFQKADMEWLDFILMCRENGDVPHDYDLVIGPTADDDTALCLKFYWDGVYGKVGELEAKKILLNNLETENLGIQYYIGKQSVANKLIADIKAVDWR